MPDASLEFTEVTSLRWGQPFAVETDDTTFQLSVSLKKTGATNPEVSVGLLCYNTAGTSLGFEKVLLDSVAVTSTSYVESTVTTKAEDLPSGTVLVYLALVSEVDAELQIDYLSIADFSTAQASAESASFAETKATAAGVSATAADGFRVSAETAAGTATTERIAAAQSSTEAQSSSSTAASEATAAASSATSAGGSATAAASDATVATTKADEAGTASAAALVSKDVAAKLMSGGNAKNPVFSDWTSTNPAYSWANVGAQGTLTKNTADAKYENAVELATGANPTEARPAFGFNANSQNGGNTPALIPAVKIIVEVELVSGTWGGSYVVAQWAPTGTGGTQQWSSQNFDGLLPDTTGVIHRLEHYVVRDDTYSAGTGDGTFQVIIYGNSGSSNPGNVIRVHRLDYEITLATSSASIQQSAIADLEGSAASSIVLRTKAGTADAEIELVAANDVDGTALSAIKLSADFIDLDGAVTIDSIAGDLQSTNFSTGVAGWKISKGGAIEAASLVVKEAMIDDLAVATIKIAESGVNEFRDFSGTSTLTQTWTPVTDSQNVVTLIWSASLPYQTRSNNSAGHDDHTTTHQLGIYEDGVLIESLVSVSRSFSAGITTYDAQNFADRNTYSFAATAGVSKTIELRWEASRSPASPASPAALGSSILEMTTQEIKR
jgi:hypothetical protein